MTKFYFQGDNEEYCYNLDYFKVLLDFEGWDEIELVEAQIQEANGFFYCKEIGVICDKSDGGCGKECRHYNPRNGKSGCCKHYCVRFFEPSGKRFILTETGLREKL